METERFIFADCGRAQHWVEICARSLNIQRSDAAIILATLCGFPTWDHMAACIGQERPTLPDEAVAESLCKARRARYVKTLSQVFSLKTKSGKSLIDHLSPSSGKPFTEVAIDAAELRISREQRASELRDRHRNFDDDEDVFRELIEDTHNPDQLECEECNERLHGDTEPVAWLSVLRALGWQIPDDLIDIDAEIGEPAMIAVDEELGEIPIYLSSVNRSPHDDSDCPANYLMNLCMTEFDTGEYGGTAFLLWAGPVCRKIRMKRYCSIGMMMFDGEWTEFLINQDCTSPSITFTRNMGMASINEGKAELADEGNVLCHAIAYQLAGADVDEDEDAWRLLMAKSPTGWNHALVVPSIILDSDE
jgi:hypothetical protein